MATSAVATPPRSTALATVPLWIDGQKSPSGSTRSGEVTNPATGQVIRTVSFADAADVDRAVKSAVAAFPAWRATTPLRRSRIINRFRELVELHQKELAAIVS